MSTIALINNPSTAYPAGSSVLYTAQLVDVNLDPVPDTDVNTMTLSIIDTQTGVIVNAADQDDILNTGRGTLDSEGNLTISLAPADTSLSEIPGNPTVVRRSLVIDWTYTQAMVTSTGRHQADFFLTALAGP